MLPEYKNYTVPICKGQYYGQLVAYDKTNNVMVNLICNFNFNKLLGSYYFYIQRD